MSESARVDSIEALRGFRTALIKFAEAANSALADSESEMSRLQNWVENEQRSYWQSQVRKRTEAVSKARDAVRQKKIFKDAAGRQQSAIDEEKLLKIAQARLEEAEAKLRNVQKYAKLLPREIEMYKGSVQRFATTVQSGIPAAVAKLSAMSGKLDAYVSLKAPVEATSTAELTGSTASSTAPSEASMARPADRVEEQPASPNEDKKE